MPCILDDNKVFLTVDAKSYGELHKLAKAINIDLPAPYKYENPNLFIETNVENACKIRTTHATNISRYEYSRTSKTKKAFKEIMIINYQLAELEDWMKDFIIFLKTKDDNVENNLIRKVLFDFSEFDTFTLFSHILETHITKSLEILDCELKNFSDIYDNKFTSSKQLFSFLLHKNAKVKLENIYTESWFSHKFYLKPTESPVIFS